MIFSQGMSLSSSRLSASLSIDYMRDVALFEQEYKLFVIVFDSLKHLYSIQYLYGEFNTDN